VNHTVRKYMLLFCCAALLNGCTAWKASERESRNLLEPLVAIPSFSSNYLMSCLNEMQTLEQKEFDTKFKLAGKDLQNGRKMDKLYFICLSLTEKADYKQLKQGVNVLEQYLEDQSDSGEGMQGFHYLVNRLEKEIKNGSNVRETMTVEKKELEKEIESLKVRLEEQNKQIEQLKNIENIIKSRDTDQP